MSRFHLEIHVTPRAGVLDPEGKAVEHALHSLGYEDADDVRVGKAISFELDAASADQARARADEMCRKLLANPVTEEYEIVLRNGTAGGGEEEAGA